MPHRIAQLTLLAALCAPWAASAQDAALRFTQQGRLLDVDGAPINGAQDLTVALHADLSTPGTEWSRTYPGLPFADGYFMVTLTGEDDTGRALEGALDAERYLSLSIDGTELGQRQPLAAVPESARTRGVVEVDQSAPCAMTGGLGYDSGTENLVVCVGGAWRRVALSESQGCPDGYVALGSSCITPTVRSAKRWDLAAADCLESSGRLCHMDEVYYACTKYAELGIAFPDTEALWVNHRAIAEWNTSQWAMTNHYYVRRGSTCFNNQSGYQPPDNTMSWSWGSTANRYHCCANAR